MLFWFIESQITSSLINPSDKEETKFDNRALNNIEYDKLNSDLEEINRLTEIDESMKNPRHSNQQYAVPANYLGSGAYYPPYSPDSYETQQYLPGGSYQGGSHHHGGGGYHPFKPVRPSKPSKPGIGMFSSALSYIKETLSGMMHKPSLGSNNPQDYYVPSGGNTDSSRESGSAEKRYVLMPGPPGLVGQIGIPGIQGPQGAQGVEGRQGIQGPEGTEGEEGIQGVMGPQGPMGIAGPEGDAGPPGVAGPAGPAGPDGSDGPAGPQGPAGPAGPNGQAGPAGNNGVAGLNGKDGPAGAPGANGAHGVPGY